MNRIDSLTNALNNYLDWRHTPYAVMINGSWGVGKTHYLLNTLVSACGDCTFHYLSLYGLTSAKDIEDRIGSQINFQASKSDKTQVICLDDLERWQGNIEHCLSYVNHLVEHLNYKCILAGNLEELSDQSTLAFSRAQEKVIRQVYHFNPPINDVLKISLSLVEPVNAASQHFIRNLVTSNQVVLQKHLTSISMRNIRLVTESLQLFELVYQHHQDTFNKTPGLAFTYLMTLLSLLLLVKRHIIEKGNRSKLLDDEHGTNKGFKFLAEIGYFDEGLSSGLTAESKILLDTIFYRLDKIPLRGLCSIVKNGFYLKADFENEFEQWKADEHFELYLDPDRFYELENHQAELVFQQTLDVLVTRQEVKNPVTILLLAERVVNDIANGVIDYNPVVFKKQILGVIHTLYKNNDMEYVSNAIFDIAIDRFINCRAIYNYIIKCNNNCLSTPSKIDLDDFWQHIFDSPDISDALIKDYPPMRIFDADIDVRDVLRNLEQLSNHQLNRVVNWIETGLDLSVDSIDINATKKMKDLALWLNKHYACALGIKATHLRRLSRALYDPNNLQADFSYQNNAIHNANQAPTATHPTPI